MSTPRRNPSANRRRRGGRGKPLDLWRDVPTPPEPDKVVPAPDPAALVDSLGPLALPGQAAAGQYVATAIGRAAALAAALAASADLLELAADD